MAHKFDPEIASKADRFDDAYYYRENQILCKTPFTGFEDTNYWAPRLKQFARLDTVRFKAMKRADDVWKQFQAHWLTLMFPNTTTFVNHPDREMKIELKKNSIVYPVSDRRIKMGSDIVLNNVEFCRLFDLHRSIQNRIGVVNRILNYALEQRLYSIIHKSDTDRKSKEYVININNHQYQYYSLPNSHGGIEIIRHFWPEDQRIDIEFGDEF